MPFASDTPFQENGLKARIRFPRHRPQSQLAARDGPICGHCYVQFTRLAILATLDARAIDIGRLRGTAGAEDALRPVAVLVGVVHPF